MPKLLFIQYRRASKVMNGGDQCTKRNYDMLCNVLGAQNVEVYLIHQEENHSPLWAYIVGAFYMLFGYFFGLTPKRVAQIAEKAKDYDYVHIDRSVFGILAKALKDSGYKGTIITHFHNVERLYFNDKMPRRLPFRNILIRCADKNDALACRFSDQLITLNQRDADCLREFYGANVRNIIPMSLPDRLSDAHATDELTAPRPRCLFLGSYFTPNNEGIIWFMNHVAPHVDIDIRIVGKGMNRLKVEQPELLRHIQVISDAPDLMPYLQWADAMILPIFSGSGMKVKTCESLMYGKNIIGTNEAFEGYAITQGISGWRCNTAEEFIAVIRDFTANPRPHFNTQARQLYLNLYSEKAIINQFKQVCSL